MENKMIHITLEEVAKDRASGRPYIIKYDTSKDTWGMSGDLYICENLSEIRKLLSEQITILKHECGTRFELNMEHLDSTTIVIAIWNIGQESDNSIITVHNINESEIEDFEESLYLI